MHSDFLKIYDEDGCLIMKEKRLKNKLYKIRLILRKLVYFTKSINDYTWLWHTRMGHTM